MSKPVSNPVISRDPEVMGGTPVFAGTRVPVRILTDHLLDNYTLNYFLDQYPTVSREQAEGFLELARETLAAEDEPDASPGEQAEQLEVSLRDDSLKIDPKPAKAYIPPTGWSDHSLHDARSLALHTKIAYKISQDPSLLDKAQENLARWRARYEPDRMPLAIEEWEQILTLDWKQVAALLIAVTEDAIRLRHSSPFTGILTEEERLRIFEAFSRE